MVHKNGLLSRANYTREFPCICPASQVLFHGRLAVYCVQCFLEAGIAAEGLMQVSAGIPSLPVAGLPHVSAASFGDALHWSPWRQIIV